MSVSQPVTRLLCHVEQCAQFTRADAEQRRQQTDQQRYQTDGNIVNNDAARHDDAAHRDAQTDLIQSGCGGGSGDQLGDAVNDTNQRDNSAYGRAADQAGDQHDDQRTQHGERRAEYAEIRQQTQQCQRQGTDENQPENATAADSILPLRFVIVDVIVVVHLGECFAGLFLVPPDNAPTAIYLHVVIIVVRLFGTTLEHNNALGQFGHIGGILDLLYLTDIFFTQRTRDAADVLLGGVGRNAASDQLLFQKMQKLFLLHAENHLFPYNRVWIFLQMYDTIYMRRKVLSIGRSGGGKCSRTDADICHYIILSNKDENINMRMRKKKHGSERLSALSALTVENPVEIRENPCAPFGQTLPLRLEIGCGKGDFIRELSLREPDFGYYAMEKVDDVLVVAVEKYAVSRGLGKLGVNGGWQTPGGEVYRDGAAWDIPQQMRGNVRFLGGDAKNLGEIFPAETFECIYANFSDPWPKKGYESRRLTAPEFLNLYETLLIDGGYFRFKTDNAELFAYSVETVTASPFEITFLTDDLHASERAEANIMTEYERNFTAKGVKIHCLEAVIRKKK